MDNVKRFGFVIDRVYDRDQFGLVGPLTEGTIYVEASDFDALQQRLSVAEQREAEFAELLADSKEIMSDISDKSYVPDALTALAALALMEKIDDALKSAADVSHEIPGTSGMRLNMLANQGE